MLTIFYRRTSDLPITDVLQVWLSMGWSKKGINELLSKLAVVTLVNLTSEDQSCMIPLDEMELD